MKHSLTALIVITAALSNLSPSAQARGSPDEAQSHPAPDQPCGWKGGSLPDPAETQRCLAARFKSPKPKPPAMPAANAAATPNG